MNCDFSSPSDVRQVFLSETMQASDSQLLTSFVHDRDEAAFRTLVARHLGLVFHTALRRTGNRAMAEEISQNVLCSLARKAAEVVRHADRLPGWLHRATVFESSKAMRAESSQQRRKHLLHPDDLPATGQAEENWGEALPHLDGALDSLAESDRRVLLLHFFERLTFPQIAGRIGKSPEAVKKQSSRALEKLSRLLRSKGVVLPVTVIAAGFASESAKAVPIALAGKVSAAALLITPAVPLTGITALMTTHSKIVVPGALLLFALPLVIQQVAISKTSRENEDLREQAANSDPALSGRAPRTRLMATRGTRISSSLDLDTLSDEAHVARITGGFHDLLLRRKLGRLAPPVLAGLIQEAGTSGMENEQKARLLYLLSSVLSERDPALAVKSLVHSLKDCRAFTSMLERCEIKYPFFGWIDRDPEGAAAWLSEQKESSDYAKAVKPAPHVGTFDPLETVLVDALLVHRPSDGLAYLANLPEDQRVKKLRDTLDGRIGSGKIDATGLEFLQAIRAYAPESERKPMLGALCDGFVIGGEGWRLLSDFVKTADLTPEEKQTIVRRAAEDLLLTQPVSDSSSGMYLDEWLNQMPPDEAEALQTEARSHASDKNYMKDRATLGSMRKDTALTDDNLVSLLGNMTTHREEALRWAGTIEDPKRREATIRAIETHTRQP